MLANDSDPDSDPLTVTGATTPAHGTAVVNANNTITYTPTTGYTGPDSFTYSISDGRGGTASATVSITVSPAGNRPPVAVSNSATTAFNTAVTINVLANDSDPDGDPLTVTGATTPAHGTAMVNANNTITYTPATGYSGPDSFTYSISDGRGGTASATVSITVSPAGNSTPYDIAVFGDVPYSSSAVTKYVRMIDNINAGTPLFSVHVGDIGPGSSATCTNATVDRETARFDTFTRPLMYTPGDNEWADCGSARLARLSYIRSTVYPGNRDPVPGADDDDARVPGRLGISGERPVAPGTGHLRHPPHGRQQGQLQQPVRVRSSPRRRPSPGSGRPSPRPRLGETRAWCCSRRSTRSSATRPPPRTGPCTTAVREETLNFSGQVLFVHGDGHDYISDRPLAGVTNLRRVEVEGDGKVSYVKVRVDPSSSAAVHGAHAHPLLTCGGGGRAPMSEKDRERRRPRLDEEALTAWSELVDEDDLVDTVLSGDFVGAESPSSPCASRVWRARRSPAPG